MDNRSEVLRKHLLRIREEGGYMEYDWQRIEREANLDLIVCKRWDEYRLLDNQYIILTGDEMWEEVSRIITNELSCIDADILLEHSIFADKLGDEEEREKYKEIIEAVNYWEDGRLIKLLIKDMDELIIDLVETYGSSYFIAYGSIEDGEDYEGEDYYIYKVI